MGVKLRIEKIKRAINYFLQFKQIVSYFYRREMWLKIFNRIVIIHNSLSE
jgi:hypothetical protein